MAHLVLYSNPTECLEAIYPHLLPHREWQSHLVIGLLNERVEPDPLDRYATTWVGKKLQTVIFIFHKSPINIAACCEIYDMRYFEDQLKLLANFIVHQPKEVVNAYNTVTGPGEVVENLIPLLKTGLGRNIDMAASIRGSYVDRDRFIPQAVVDPSHTMRQANVHDNIPAMASLVREFQKETAMLHAPMPLDELIAVLPRPIGRGQYYIYTLPDGTVPALVMVRRPTPAGISIVMVVTDPGHRRKGYGAALTSYVIQHALRPVEEGGRGKEHLCIFWIDGGNAGRIYERLGFVRGMIRQDWKIEGNVGH